MPVTVTTAEGVAFVTLANPPVNAISPWVPQALIDALAVQDRDPGITAIVLRGEGRCFSAGADIAAFKGPRQPGPTLRDLLDAFDALSKPVVMAVHGLAYGGGLEIALTGDARICSAEARFA